MGCNYSITQSPNHPITQLPDYPIPRFKSLPMDRETREKLVAQYKDGYRVVAEAIAGAADEELDTRPAPHKWSAREIVHHLADSEMTSAIRLRLLIASDRPQIT